MKLEIEVELPEDIAKDWEVVKIGVPVEGEYVITSFGDVRAFDREKHDAIPRIILRRKLNPRDWWPEWVLAKRITFEQHGAIRFHGANGTTGYWSDASSLLDLSWVPEHLRRSGMTIQNPWKGEQQ